MNRVVVVGSANIDIIAVLERLPRPGETLLGREVTYQTGGKGANQVIAASRLGADTTFHAAVGADAFGRQVREVLLAEGVDADHVIVVDGVATGVAMIEVAADGENTIVVASGANFALTPSAIPDFAASLAGELAAGDVVVLQLEIPIETCLAATVAAREANARVVLNAAPLPEPDDLAFRALLRGVDVLIVNETEAAALSRDTALTNRAPEDWANVARDLCDLGPAATVITLGSQGAAACDGDGAWIQPAFPADVIDTTGAGDAFCGSLAAALAEGAGLAEAVLQGCAAGALATGSLGAQTALPAKADLNKLIDTKPNNPVSTNGLGEDA